MHYSIGEFSNIVRVSAKSLRHYDKIGLFSPSHVDPSSRYRYYSEKQIKDILLIIELKSFDFGLTEIKSILSDPSPTALTAHLRKKSDFFSEEIKRLQLKREHALKKAAALESSNDIHAIYNKAKYNIKVLKEQFVYTKRRVIDIKDGEAFTKECENELRDMGLEAKMPYIGIYYYENNEVSDYSNLDTELCIHVSQTKKCIADDINFRTIPSGEYLCQIHIGSTNNNRYNDNIDEIYYEMMSWIDENRYTIRGIPIEIIWKTGYNLFENDEYIIEICIPIDRS